MCFLATYNQSMKKADDELSENSETGGKDSNADEDSRDQSQSNQDDLPPAGNRGEPDDNLRRRSDWFQKRTGGR